MAGTGSASPSRTDDLVALLLNKHTALSISGTLLLYTAAKILYFARFDVQASLAIIAATDRSQLLFSSLTGLVAIALPVFALTQPVQDAIARGNSSGSSLTAKFLAAFITFCVIPLTFGFLSPLLLFAIAAGFIVLLVRTGAKIRRARGRSLRRGRRAQRPTSSPSLRISVRQDTYRWVMVSIAVFIVFQSLIAPWLPPERVSFADREPIGAYVVGESAGFTLLLDMSRSPIWIATSELEARELCVRGEGWWWSRSFARIARESREEINTVECPR